ICLSAGSGIVSMSVANVIIPINVQNRLPGWDSRLSAQLKAYAIYPELTAPRAAYGGWCCLPILSVTTSFRRRFLSSKIRLSGIYLSATNILNDKVFVAVRTDAPGVAWTIGSRHSVDS